MAKSPVRPGTPVVIFERSKKAKKSPVKKTDPEEVISKLRQSVHHLKIWVAVSSVLFLLASAAAGYLFFSQDDQPPIGQNYQTIIDATDDAQ
jgi:hypothetical protein